MYFTVYRSTKIRRRFAPPGRDRIPFSQALQALDEAMQVSTAPVWLPSYWLSRAFQQRFVDKHRVFVDAWLGGRWNPQLGGNPAREALERERTRKNMRRRTGFRAQYTEIRVEDIRTGKA